VLVLGIETATAQPSVAIGSQEGIIAASSISRGSNADAFLLPTISYLMEKADVSYRNISSIAVGIGPGLYTGMRVGVTTGKTLAQALSIPISAVSSLDLLAFSIRHTEKLICPVIDAKRGEVFFSFYRSVPGGITRVDEYQVATSDGLVAELEGTPEHTILVGQGSLMYRDELEEAGEVEFASPSHAYPRAESLVDVAVQRAYREDFDLLNEVQPMYMRRSDAELNWEAKRG
jgi:tRNA threonylcarbamoyladenosine biosynthesis protein TsaB